MSDRVTTLYADVDGTLVGPGGDLFADAQRLPTLRAAAALVEARRSGLEVVVLSGRDRRRVADLLRVLGLRTGIAELGGVRVRDGGAHVEREPGDVEALRGALAGLVGEFPGRLEEHTPWNDQREVSLMLRGDVALGDAQRWLDDHGYGWVAFTENGISARTFASLPGVARPRIFHVAPREVSKRAGIVADQRARGIDPHRCAVVGDAPADLDCAPVVARCFIVRNGVAHVAGLGAAVESTPNAVVTAGSYGDGFAEAVEALLAGAG